MGIDHRGADILVTEEFLDGPDIGAVFQQMRGERMPKGVTARELGEQGQGPTQAECYAPPSILPTSRSRAP